MPTLKYLQTKFVEHLSSRAGGTNNESDKIFAAVESPEEAFQHLWSRGFPSQFEIPFGNININRKGAKESEAFRNEGNRLYKSRKYDKTLLAYNYALLAAPHPTEIDNQESDDTLCPQLDDVLFKSKYSEGQQFSELAFAYANRSALLLELEQHKLAILDIHNAIQYGYTFSKQYKMHERKMKCLIGLRRFDEAKLLANKLLEKITHFNIEPKELSQVKSNINKQVLRCTSDLSTDNAKKAEPDSNKKQSKKCTNEFNTTEKRADIESNNRSEDIKGGGKFEKIFFRGGQFPPRPMVESRHNRGCVSTAVAVDHSPSKGRHLVATRDIEPGEILLVEKSYASFLLFNSCLRTYCSHCLRRAAVPEPCPTCSLVVFCSSSCRSSALAPGGAHDIECPILPALVALQPEVDAGLAFRVMTSMGMVGLASSVTNLKHKGVIKTGDPGTQLSTVVVDSTKEELQRLLDEDGGPSGYEFMYTLEGNHSLRSLEEKREACITAMILVKLLMRCPKFWGSSADSFDETSVGAEDISTLGGHLTRAILNIQCNAHCVKELKLTYGQPLKQSQYNDIGYAVYKKLSLLNHSCTANAHQSSCGNSKVLYTVSRIAKGDEITMSYGERFVSHKKDERRKNLKDAYYFTCECTACKLDWPMFEELPMKFSLRCCKCSSQVDATTSKCKKCQLLHRSTNKKVNNKKGKKSGQQETPQNLYDAQTCQNDIGKAWQGYNQAFASLEKYEVHAEDALNVQKLLSLMDRFAQLPNKPYIEAQETFIRWCDYQCAAAYNIE